MKIQQDKEFKPITVVIETEKEAAELYKDLQKSNCYSTGQMLAKYLYDNELMDSKKADKLLGVTND